MVCRKQLSTGEELYVLDENKFICKEDYLNSKYNGKYSLKYVIGFYLISLSLLYIYRIYIVLESFCEFLNFEEQLQKYQMNAVKCNGFEVINHIV